MFSMLKTLFSTLEGIITSTGNITINILTGFEAMSKDFKDEHVKTSKSKKKPTIKKL